MKFRSCGVLSVQMERLRSFDFDVWKMQYLQWMKNNRSRIMDYFHRLDTDGDGKVTRKQFIEGIIKSRMSSFLSVVQCSIGEVLVLKSLWIKQFVDALE